jgi:hypothetical protein
MREVTSHRPGKILLWVLSLSAIWYVLVLPFVLQGTHYLLFGWMPVAVVFYNLQTILWLLAFWIYTARYWPYR